MSTSTTDPSLTELVNQQQALKRDIYAIISMFFELQTQCRNDHFLGDLLTYDGKGDRSFLDWITQVERLLSQCLEIQLVRAMAEGIVCKHIDDMTPSSRWDTVKRRLCQVFSSVACSHSNLF